MPITFVSDDAAQRQRGLRMVFIKGIASPWGEAAKGLLKHKGIDYTATYLDVASEAQAAWTGGLRSAPIAVYKDEPSVGGWQEILLLAERLEPHIPLLPESTEMREKVLTMSNDFCGEDGLGWHRRVQIIDAGLRGEGGFPKPIATYLGNKYGFSEAAAEAATPRVVELLSQFASRLKLQRGHGSEYYVGDSLTAVDFYSASFLGLFDPLPEHQCAMHPSTRMAFQTLNSETVSALDPILFSHRDRVYEEHLEVPLSL